MTATCEAPGCTDEAVLAVKWRSETMIYCNYHGKQAQIEYPAATVIGHRGDEDSEEVFG